MTMPREIVFARHGQSEANVVQKHDDHGVRKTIAAAIFERPDWKNRLTDLGVEQAQAAKKVIERELSERRRYFGSELLQQASERAPRLLANVPELPAMPRRELTIGKKMFEWARGGMTI